MSEFDWYKRLRAWQQGLFLFTCRVLGASCAFHVFGYYRAKAKEKKS